MALPLVGTSLLFYALERIHSPSPCTCPLISPLDPKVALSPQTPSTPAPIKRKPTKRSFTPRVTKSSIVQPSSDLSSSTASLSTPAPRSPHPTTPSPQPQPSSSSSSFPFPSASTPISPSATSSPLLTSAARRRDPSTSNSSYSTPPSSSQKPRQRTPSITSRRSSISSSAGTSSANYHGGFHPVSQSSSKPLPPLLHSNSSTQGEEGIEDYFNVGKGKENESIGLGRPPPPPPSSSSSQPLDTPSKSMKVANEKEGAQEIKKRSFSFPSFLKRSPSSSSSNKVPPTTETGKGEKDVEERLRNSMALSGASGSTMGKGKGK